MHESIDFSQHQQKLRRATNVFTSEIDNEVVMAHLQNGKYYGLNAVGTALWKFLAEPRTFPEICTHLLAKFEVDEACCRQDTREVLTQLLHANLVKVVEV